jgi:sulfur-oxidizing protein SoxX
MKLPISSSLAIIAGITASAAAPGPAAGDPDRGREVFLDRELGHCLLCHQVAQLDAPFQGNIGPDLSNVGDRLPASVIRERIADPTALNPETVMPAYARTDSLIDVDERYQGRPILDAHQFEDLVAFVTSLKKAPGKQDDG